jgi:peptidoglycan/xylan/chitin deacetylase (PgdA/CDA1 family)
MNMNNRKVAVSPKWAMVCLVLCGILVLMTGCSTLTGTDDKDVIIRPRFTASPAPILNNEPADVYGSVLTNNRVVSIIFEGYSDEVSMRAVLETLKQYQIPSVFFISGATAEEHPVLVKEIAQSGFLIGNYGLSAPKKMQDQDIQTNLHQFRRGQELLEKATGTTPKMFRCNGSVYTRELLQTAASAGLEAGIIPSVYLNHRSFSSKEDAQMYTQQLLPGAIISIKLGQELDAEEYERAIESKENLAIDPPPNLSDDMEELMLVRYANVAQVASWLLETLKEEGYTVLLPQALQNEQITMFDTPNDLDAQALAQLDETTYTLPVTSLPLGIGETLMQSAGQFSGLVMVGDSITQGLESYVTWRRQSDPAYMGDTRFLTSSFFGIQSSLMRVTGLSAHPQVDSKKMTIANALQMLQAKTVILMPGLSDVSGHSQSDLIKSIKLTIYQIRKENPGIQIILQSIPPGMAQKPGKPDNFEIFRYNLAVYKFSLQHSIPFIDTAFALRDSEGNLSRDLCIDPDTLKYHLNDKGCQLWIDYLQLHWPL